MPDSVAEMISAIRQGDQDAAFDLHNRYATRLLKLVRWRLNPKLNRRMDPEDVVQSAFRSFFRVVQEDGMVENAHAERIWGLLAAITVNKLNSRVRHHFAGKRTIDHETAGSPELLGVADCKSELEAAFLDELNWVVNGQIKRHQLILEMLLEGTDERLVAEKNGCTLRTVYRVIERTVTQLQQRLDI